MVEVEFETLGRKALRPLSAGRTKGRNGGIDLALFQDGVNPADTINRVRRNPIGDNPEGFFDGVQALGEPPRVMFLASNNLHVDDDACKIVNGRVLLVGRAQRGLR